MPIETTRRMSDSEVHSLLREYKIDQDLAIRDRIVAQYSNLVESIARRFAVAAEPAEDLVQEGYIGLLTAVEGYNADKGVKFSTYATHFIIGQIKHHLRDRGKIIKEPAWLQELNQKVTRVIESLSQELGRVPTNGEIAKLMGMTEESIAELLTTREVFKVASLDGGGEQDDEGSTTYDMDRVKTARHIEVEIPVEERLVLDTALTKLKELEQTVVHEFYFNGHNQTEIARGIGISCNYVSHILRSSTKKLKKILVTDELKEAQKEVLLLRKRAEDQARIIDEQTVVDSQTRLYNRRYFDSRLDEEISRGSRHQQQLAVVLIRLEGYDQVGRAYGTIRSEETIRGAAGLITSSVRKADIVTRFDECTFGLILPHTGGQASVVVDRLRSELEAWLAEKGLESGRIAIGVRCSHANFPEAASSASALIACAHSELEQQDEAAVAA